MENTERQKFEESWKEAFDGSEMTPSDSVWSNIDLKLDNEKMKKRVVYYQRLAAASVIFALLLGVGATQYFRNASSTNTLAQKSETSSDNSELNNEPTLSPDDKKDNELTVEKDLASKTESELKSNSENVNGISNSIEKSTKTNRTPDNRLNQSLSKQDNINQHDRSKDNLIALEDSKETYKAINTSSDLSTRESSISHSSDRLSFYLPVYVEIKELSRRIRTLEDEVKSLPEMPSSMMNTASNKNKQEGLWLSVGAAAGSYNPGGNPTSSPAAAFQPSYASSSLVNYDALKTTSDNNKRSSVGTAYSFGFSIGKKIAPRWLVHGGFNYMNQMIMYTSNYSSYSASNQSEAFVADYAGNKNSSVRPTQPYKVNSSLEFVTLPVQIGYLIIDRKLAWQLNTGVATDFFLRNTLKDQSGNLDKYSQGSGGDSPYRSVNYAALASTELSYKIGSQYRLALVPGMRYSFQPTLKSQSASSYNPFVLDIGFRFRYIFK